MNRKDFETCTPPEFSEIYRQHLEDGHSAWERTRMLAFSVLAPFSNKRMSPKDVMRFSWDGEEERAERKTDVEKSTPERAQEVAKRAGMKK